MLTVLVLHGDAGVTAVHGLAQCRGFEEMADPSTG
jgi:hypothetical protein